MDREIVASVRQFCSDAWYGERPALRGFSLQMLREGDGTRTAKSSGAFRIDSLVAA